MKAIHWSSEREFSIEGVTFECTYDDYSRKSGNERLAILKGRGMLEQYAQVFAADPPKTVLEFGIFQGGSPALYALWLQPEKLVAVDICPPVAAFDEFCRTNEAGRRIRSYYEVSQTDGRRIEEIVRREFESTALDLIIDDASHLYKNTRITFETAFPLLRPGGLYVIEDWGWAHWPGNKLYLGETPLSMFIMELAMLCASRSDIVSEVRLFPAFALIRKSPDARSLPNFSVSSSYHKRGIVLVGAKNADLGGIARLLGNRVLDSTRKKLNIAWRRMRGS